MKVIYKNHIIETILTLENEIRFIHPITGQQCESFDQVFISWSEQDVKDNEEIDRMKELFKENEEDIYLFLEDELEINLEKYENSGEGNSKEEQTGGELVLWTTGMTVDCISHGEWIAKCNWQGGDIEGEIRTKYCKPTIKQVIDEVLEIMDRFKIKKCNEILDMEFSLFRKETENQPEDVLQTMRNEAKCRGWKYYF